MPGMLASFRIKESTAVVHHGQVSILSLPRRRIRHVRCQVATTPNKSAGLGLAV